MKMTNMRKSGSGRSRSRESASRRLERKYLADEPQVKRRPGTLTVSLSVWYYPAAASTSRIAHAGASYSYMMLAVLDEIRDEWAVVTDADVSSANVETA